MKYRDIDLHNHDGNCRYPKAKSCPSYCGMDEECAVCHRHDQPRMGCSECQPCGGCEPAGGGRLARAALAETESKP